MNNSQASVKSAFSTSAPSKLVPVRTVFLNIVPRKDEPPKLARSTIPFVKSAPSKFDPVEDKEY